MTRSVTDSGSFGPFLLVFELEGLVARLECSAVEKGLLLVLLFEPGVLPVEGSYVLGGRGDVGVVPLATFVELELRNPSSLASMETRRLWMARRALPNLVLSSEDATVAGVRRGSEEAKYL